MFCLDVHGGYLSVHNGEKNNWAIHLGSVHIISCKLNLNRIFFNWKKKGHPFNWE